MSAAQTPLNLSLDEAGVTLLEASAGTGKTYALTTLAARLIVEGRREIGNLLIVTFTVAATDELRDKIRATLRAALRCVSGEAVEAEGQARELLARWASLSIAPAEAGRRLEQAVADLDRANVLTIHGFCQRVLQDFAFECGLPFGFEVGGDRFDAIGAAVRDDWRRGFHAAPAARVRFAKLKRFMPGLSGGWGGDSLTGWIGKHAANPTLRLRGAEPLNDAAQQAVSSAEAAWDGALARASKAVRGAAPTATPAGALAPLLLALERPLAFLFGPKAPSEAFARLAEACDAPAELAGRLAEVDDQGKALLDAYARWLPRQRRAALEAIREQLRRRLGEDRRLSYDDLLLAVHAALKAKPALAERIRERYPFALIDEYQDTDRLQAEIFERIYARGAGSMVIVGDPKQSIYRFRGADIFAYLRAKKTIDERRQLSLVRNYRSAPQLVEAVNALFNIARPFALPDVAFNPVDAALETTALRIEGEAPDAKPLQFRLFPGAGSKRLNKGEATALAAPLAAKEIASLLQAAQCGRATLSGRPLAGSDIAVLVRKADQGREVAAALRRLGVPSVEIGDDDVFATREAQELERLLWAVAKPHAPDRARGALAGDLFGMDANGLAQLADNDEAWNLWRERLDRWHGIWAASGVATMIRRLLWSFDGSAPAAAAQEPTAGGARQLLRHADGDRRFTNVLHLADLLQQAEAAGPLAPAGVAAWLSRRRAQAKSADEVAQLRLDSDEQLVKIVTIHRSKGLEFPIVFCPFAWDGRNPNRGRSSRWDAQFHDRKDGDLPEVLHLSPTAEQWQQDALEAFSEEARLFYVALTRAQFRCVVTWARANDSEFAPLAWLLRQESDSNAAEAVPEAALQAARKAAKAFSAEGWLKQMEALVSRCPDGIAAAEAAGEREPPSAPAAATLPELGARTLRRPLRRVRQMTSYSALARGGTALGHLAHEAAERPDHDADADANRPEDDAAAAAAQAPKCAAAFPAGARAGSCLHDIFERLARDGGLANVEAVVGERLARHRIDAAWRAVARDMVVNAWTAPLRASSGPRAGRTWRIAELRRPVPELEFHLPVQGLDQRALGRALAAHGYDNSLAAAAGEPIDGYLRGFIDLLAQRDGCWHVVDYKSNLLGTQAADYAPDRLDAAMRRQGYRLQYLLYQLALHRYLKLRLADYAYDRHVGGVFYLFVRGIDANGGDGGIYFDRPSAACIEAVDACFAGAAAP